MKVAFTAPMKPLDHPVPSGDRTMGRLFVQALKVGGHEVDIVSSFRSWTKTANEEVQRAIRDDAWREADRIAENWEQSGSKPDIFLTYHLYHKAPDWIGPRLAERFDLPYAILEASRAPKRQTGDWAFGFAEADKALTRADIVGALHNADAGCLRPVLNNDHLSIMLPFIDTAPFEAAKKTRSIETPLKLLTVGMMRPGDKTKSYEVLAAALNHIADLPWQLTIIGDGETREQILSLFPQDRIIWLGALPPEDLPEQYAAHDLFVWPAIREAFGLVFLEAQASGLGVIAGDTFGVPDIVKNEKSGFLSKEGDVEAFARNLRRALENPVLCRTLGKSALDHVKANHTLKAGADRLTRFLSAAIANHSRRIPS